MSAGILSNGLDAYVSCLGPYVRELILYDICMLTLPGAIMTWTSTGTASMPWNATVRTRETMPSPKAGCAPQPDHE
jgi:hypothetical protein